MGNLSSVPRGWTAAVLLLGALVLGIAAFPARAAEVPRHFDIPAEPLGTALDEFARQANVTLLFSSTLVAQVHTRGVSGSLAVTAALGQLLGGTGLEFRQVSQSAIAIVESPSSATAPGRPLMQPGGDLAAGASRGSTASGTPGVLHRLASLLTHAARALGGGGKGPTAPADARAIPSYNSLREVVVTGTPEVSGVKLLDASFPVSEASLQQIQLAQASSAADLLKIVPGLWAESSGGETGPTSRSRAFPAAAMLPT